METTQEVAAYRDAGGERGKGGATAEKLLTDRR
jgi:hypothetical protein